MYQGKIIEYIDQGKIFCSICIQDKGNRLHLLTPLNRQVNLSPKRALLVSSTSFNHERPRDEILSRLREAEIRRNHLKEEINVRDLWELIKDENECFDYKYLAQLCFGEEVTDDHISAMVRALFEDKFYFKMKEGAFVPNPEERVEQIILQQEQEAMREDGLKQGSAWLTDVISNKECPQRPAPKGIIETLISLALYGKDSPDFKYGAELLSRSGISDTGKARDILILLGVWEKDEPVDLHRFGIKTCFPEHLLAESDRLAPEQVQDEGRRDLRHLECFTIDGPLTLDFDDALSFEIRDDYIHLGIHIADVAGVILPGSALDKEAFHRGSSLYLPRHQIPMIPEGLSHGRLSLKKGCDRPAISLLTRFDKSGNLFDYCFLKSIINVRHQFTYDEINKERMSENTFNMMFILCEQLQKKRLEQGALILSLPEICFCIENGSPVSINMIPQDTPSRMIVAEFMVLYNWLAARFCRDNNIPILYRAQKKPSEILPMDEKGYVYYVLRQLRKIPPLIVNTKPAPHAGIGLEVYSNASSPIRRYLDLVVQRQIRSYLNNTPLPYNMEDLEGIRLPVIESLRDLNIIKRNRTRYWILKYLSINMNKNYPALILGVMKNKYRMVLADFLLTAEMKRERDQNFKEGQEIYVRVLKADPWTDSLILKHAG